MHSIINYLEINVITVFLFKPSFTVELKLGLLPMACATCILNELHTKDLQRTIPTIHCIRQVFMLIAPSKTDIRKHYYLIL